MAVIVLGKQTDLRRDREQLSGYRCYQGSGCGLPAPIGAWRGQEGKENNLGLPGRAEGVFVVALAEEIFACQNVCEMWCGEESQVSPGLLSVSSVLLV